MRVRMESLLFPIVFTSHQTTDNRCGSAPYFCGLAVEQQGGVPAADVADGRLSAAGAVRSAVPGGQLPPAGVVPAGLL